MNALMHAKRIRDVGREFHFDIFLRKDPEQFHYSLFFFRTDYEKVGVSVKLCSRKCKGNGLRLSRRETQHPAVCMRCVMRSLEGWLRAFQAEAA